MRKLYLIFITLFVVVTIYGAKNEIQSLLAGLGVVGNANQAKIESEKLVNQKEYINLNDKSGGEVVAPGPLKVFRDILNVSENILDPQKVIDETNKARMLNGLSVGFVYNQQLSASAMVKLNDMLDQQYFEHTSPSGIKIDTLVKNEGYEFIVIGENLALGNFKDEKDLVDAWMNSLPHRENILNTRYKDIGIAVKEGNFEGKNVWVAVQHFGLYIDECPSVDALLKLEIIKDQKELELENVELEKLEEIINQTKNKDEEKYKSTVDSYNKLVKKYDLNKIEYKKEIKSFNDQVKVFNFCASGNRG